MLISQDLIDKKSQFLMMALELSIIYGWDLPYAALYLRWQEKKRLENTIKPKE